MIYRGFNCFALAVVSNRVGLVESVENTVAADIVASHQSKGTSRDSQLLTKKGETACRETAVVSALQAVAAVGVQSVSRIVVIHGAGESVLVFRKRASSEIELRFKDEGGVLGEFVLQTHAEACTPGLGVALSLGVVQKAGVIKQSLLERILDDGLGAMVEHPVAADVHVAVEEVGTSIDAGHVGRGDTVAAAPAALAATHSAWTH